MRTIFMALSFIVLVPAVALACPVCGLAGTQDNWHAYLSMSAMLSVLPLGMIGGVVFWIYRRARG